MHPRVLAGHPRHRDGIHPLEVDAADALRRILPSPAEADIARWSGDTIALLGAPAEVRAQLATGVQNLAPAADGRRTAALPFEPKSFRDFMLYERHAIDAARGFVRRFLPGAARVVGAYEAVIRAPFPKLKPHALWYRQPIYYMGNHLAFAGDGDAVAIPAYSKALDYELELGFVLAHGLFDATPEEAEAAIGGFVVINDFSARDVQLDEMRSGFGPQKSKHFRNAMSGTIVSADEILGSWRDLKGFVRINGHEVAAPSTAGPRTSCSRSRSPSRSSRTIHWRARSWRARTRGVLVSPQWKPRALRPWSVTEFARRWAAPTWRSASRACSRVTGRCRRA